MGSASQTMKRALHRLEGFAKEFRNHTVIWAVLVSVLAYLLSCTSSSVWLNVPVTAIFFIVIRYLSFELKICRKVHPSAAPSHLAHLLKNQLFSDELLLSSSTPSHWRRKIDSPIIEKALDDFTRLIIQEFVMSSWYSALSPDQDVPEQICLLIMDIFGEISQRLKRINLINLLTRDMIELVENHLRLFRQAKCSIRRFEYVSVEDREKELKIALTKGNQLHPALSSPDSEIKVLQQLMGGMLAIVLRPNDAQCVLMRGLARELLACAVLRPIINLVSPGFINKNIERALDSARAKRGPKTTEVASACAPLNAVPVKGFNKSSAARFGLDDSASGRHEDRRQMFDEFNERKSRTLAAGNSDILQSKGQDYKNRDVEEASIKSTTGLVSAQMNEVQPAVKDMVVRHHTSKANQGRESDMSAVVQSSTASRDVRQVLEVTRGGDKRHESTSKNQHDEPSSYTASLSLPSVAQRSVEKRVNNEGAGLQLKHTQSQYTGSENWQKREHATVSSNFSALDYWDSPGMQMSLGGNVEEPVTGWLNESVQRANQDGESPSASKLNCWVVGAHLEKAASETFAVYSIAVTDTENKTWFVERRFRNFEQLHRNLRDLPQYNLQLPPKRFLASSLDETFVRDRCILLDKYLKDLLSIPSIAELHEVWDFLSITSKKYAHSKLPSVMKTFAVNVDDAVDDMFRQLRGVSDGLLRRVGGSSSDNGPAVILGDGRKLTLVPEAASSSSLQIDKGNTDAFLDEEFTEVCSSTPPDVDNVIDNWLSDNDQYDATGNGLLSRSLSNEDKNGQWLEKRMDREGSDLLSVDESTSGSETNEEELAVPPECTSPKLTEPLLSLVDNIFQLQDQAWIRSQIVWITKQILQLGIGDAVDDWLISQIQQLRQEDVIAGCIRSIQEILWPGGVFVTKIQRGVTSDTGSSNKFVKQASQRVMEQSISFESQLEAARCAKAVHDCLVEGAPKRLVSIVGKRRYKKCAKDIFYFLQSSLFLRQLFFSILETLLVTLFPEMTHLLLDIRKT